ncbi:hypothetical protein [Hymenobacter sp. GOD-10R]|uniref:MarR family winged helix-turn-helix transcriptional regulator n=1 Tax=Hymenobacter sp. GOD-10R TaxID=3093922 RepID=UPI002D7703BA|nr:hypothetical protein [Hymenobacter sp. GOD-10R]WRQ31644.1 hypothetical protein SD425_27820 [Hymenobacter sp. GOD-10R]
MNYAFLQRLLASVEEFEAQHKESPSDALADFAQWLHVRTSPSSDLATVTREATQAAETLESRISKLITFLYRYARFYSRLALDGSVLFAFEDFSYLVTVNCYGPLSKTELIARNIHEKSSGTEVIKRLLKQALLTEQPHPSDRRRRELTLSSEGRRTLYQVFERMHQEAHMVAGNLDTIERHQLLYLLLKLDTFHYPVFSQNRAPTFESLIETHFPQLRRMESSREGVPS